MSRLRHFVAPLDMTAKKIVNKKNEIHRISFFFRIFAKCITRERYISVL